MLCTRPSRMRLGEASVLCGCLQEGPRSQVPPQRNGDDGAAPEMPMRNFSAPETGRKGTVPPIFPQFLQIQVCVTDKRYDTPIIGYIFDNFY
mmetsp:Transcript_14342/g.31203  ORF Transcript_14342/g.31203 Transcript_14342/m.31203 type:complete len:92 (-) Transcript_14342:117-392(-)